MRHCRIVSFVILTAVAVVLVGCGRSDNSEARTFVAKFRDGKPDPIDAPPTVPVYEPFTYKARGRRQPFRPARSNNEGGSDKASSGPRPNPKRHREPLEQYTLGSLSMMGTVEFHDVTYALIRTPTGSIFRVKTGQYLGKHSGKIRQVNTSGLVMREIVPKGTGGYQKKRTTLSFGQ